MITYERFVHPDGVTVIAFEGKFQRGGYLSPTTDRPYRCYVVLGREPDGRLKMASEDLPDEEACKRMIEDVR